MDFKSLFVPFRYAPLHKERFKNSKLYLGLKIKCKFETGLRSEKCKLNSGRVNWTNMYFFANFNPTHPMQPHTDTTVRDNPR